MATVRYVRNTRHAKKKNVLPPINQTNNQTHHPTTTQPQPNPPHPPPRRHDGGAAGAGGGRGRALVRAHPRALRPDFAGPGGDGACICMCSVLWGVYMGVCMYASTCVCSFVRSHTRIPRQTSLTPLHPEHPTQTLTQTTLYSARNSEPRTSAAARARSAGCRPCSPSGSRIAPASRPSTYVCACMDVYNKCRWACTYSQTSPNPPNPPTKPTKPPPNPHQQPYPPKTPQK